MFPMLRQPRSLKLHQWHLNLRLLLLNPLLKRKNAVDVAKGAADVTVAGRGIRSITARNWVAGEIVAAGVDRLDVEGVFGAVVSTS